MARPIRVVLITQYFSKTMGYIENLLPRHLSRAGAEVHVVAMNLSANFVEDGKTNLDEPSSELVPGSVEAYDGYTLHVLPHVMTLGYPRAQGFIRTLRRIQPDIVQTIVAIGWIPFEAAVAQPFLGYKLFTGCHTLKGHFPLARDPRRLSLSRAKNFAMRWLPGRGASLRTERCYAQATDCAEIAEHFFGVQDRKIEVLSNGVDTDLFHPVADAADIQSRVTIRSGLGIEADELVCIYSGKLSQPKNVVLLARAIEQLCSEGLRFRGLFIGAGSQREELDVFPNSVVLPTMPHSDLPRYYRAADIGVWHTNETLSTLDAAATGLPLVIGDLVTDRDHMEGNGILCRAHDLDDLIRVLRALSDAELRFTLGRHGRQKMLLRYSWAARARHRLTAYEKALVAGRDPRTASLRP